MVGQGYAELSLSTYFAIYGAIYHPCKQAEAPKV